MVENDGARQPCLYPALDPDREQVPIGPRLHPNNGIGGQGNRRGNGQPCEYEGRQLNSVPQCSRRAPKKNDETVRGRSLSSGEGDTLPPGGPGALARSWGGRVAGLSRTRRGVGVGPHRRNRRQVGARDQKNAQLQVTGILVLAQGLAIEPRSVTRSSNSTTPLGKLTP